MDCAAERIRTSDSRVALSTVSFVPAPSSALNLEYLSGSHNLSRILFHLVCRVYSVVPNAITPKSIL